MLEVRNEKISQFYRDRPQPSTGKREEALCTLVNHCLFLDYHLPIIWHLRSSALSASVVYGPLGISAWMGDDGVRLNLPHSDLKARYRTGSSPRLLPSVPKFGFTEISEASEADHAETVSLAL